MCGANTDKERGAAAAHTKTKKGRVVLKESYKPLLTPWKIGKVEIKAQENEIIFTDKKDKDIIYKTGMVNDDELTKRLYESGAKFSGEIQRQTSPWVSLLMYWVLPIVLFIFLGRYMSKKMMDKAGGNSMMFGMGKSNAKIYVKSSEGIRFDDVAGEDEAKENLAEIVEYLHDPSKYREIGASMPKGVLLVGPPGTGKTLLAKARYLSSLLR